MQWLKHKILSFQTIIWLWKKWLKTHKIHSQCTSNGTILKGKLQKTLQNRARNILKLHLNFDNSVYRKKTFTFYYKHGSGLFWKLIGYWTKNLINLPNNNRFFPGFQPQPLKRGQIKNILLNNWRILFWLSSLLFWFDHFL